MRAHPLSLVVGMDGTGPGHVLGHPCALVEGFEGFGRLIQLTVLALRDLLSNWSAPLVAPGRIALLLNLPSSVERPLLDEHLAGLFEEGLEADEAGVLSQAVLSLVEPVLRQATVHSLQEGHTGAMIGLQWAAELLEAGRADACIICGVDSHLDLPTLEWLNAMGQLKTVDNPMGMMPGEGAGAFVVERERSATQRGAGILTRPGALALSEEPSGYMDQGFNPTGHALAMALQEVIRLHPPDERELRTVITDLNGRPRRAMDFGHALVRCSHAFHGLSGLKLWTPAASFGDVGGATAAFLICMAVRAFARGYSGGRELLLFSCSEQGQRAALVLDAPGHP
ncbi:hypothetical protein ACN28E_44205 [Archangium lansingense]|uniref:hypothetical protein n=1 Tax=Archangium lansingense TaxID=2995310 RepID=UPI003B7E41AE